MTRLTILAALIALPLASQSAIACEQHESHAVLPQQALAPPVPPPAPAMPATMSKIPDQAIATSKTKLYTGSYSGCRSRQSEDTVYLTQ